MDLKSMAAVLSDAAALQNGNENGMRISLPGLLSHAQRALAELARPFEDAPEHIEQQFESRMMESQPTLHAHGLTMCIFQPIVDGVSG